MSDELKQIQQDLRSVKTDVTEIKTALKGYNGKMGLCDQVEKNTSHIKRLTIIVVLIAASLGGGVWGAIKLALGG